MAKQIVLKKLRQIWPDIRDVRDATEPVNISVEDQDRAKGRRKSSGECALARACVRTGIADAALIGAGTSYLKRGTVAIRYSTPESVAREVVSFDRHGDFAPGRDYHLAKMKPSQCFGAREGERRGREDGSRPQKRRAVVIHRTVRIRSQAL